MKIFIYAENDKLELKMESQKTTSFQKTILSNTKQF